MGDLSETESAVWVQYGSSTFYLSPGCTVTRSISRYMQIVQVPAQINNLTTTGQTENDTIRVDARVFNCLSPVCDGYSDVAEIDISYMADLLCSLTSSATAKLHWCGVEYPGLVKSLTITQRPGEGALYDVSLTFEVGNNAGG